MVAQHLSDDPSAFVAVLVAASLALLLFALRLLLILVAIGTGLLTLPGLLFVALASLLLCFLLCHGAASCCRKMQPVCQHIRAAGVRVFPRHPAEPTSHLRPNVAQHRARGRKR
jgi:hypothetical protein